MTQRVTAVRAGGGGEVCRGGGGGRGGDFFSLNGIVLCRNSDDRVGKEKVVGSGGWGGAGREREAVCRNGGGGGEGINIMNWVGIDRKETTERKKGTKSKGLKRDLNSKKEESQKGQNLTEQRKEESQKGRNLTKQRKEESQNGRNFCFFGHVLFQFLCNLQQYCNSAYNKLNSLQQKEFINITKMNYIWRKKIEEREGDKHTCTHACTRARTHARTHTRTHSRTHTHTHARTHARTYTHTQFQTKIQAIKRPNKQIKGSKLDLNIVS